jgi:xanthine/uracil permease
VNVLSGKLGENMMLAEVAHVHRTVTQSGIGIGSAVAIVLNLVMVLRYILRSYTK